jgi:hypothetical protein
MVDEIQLRKATLQSINNYLDARKICSLLLQVQTTFINHYVSKNYILTLPTSQKLPDMYLEIFFG